jgi:tripartite-type tricarboxylate transporter receptor subunit TctC
MPWLQVCAPCQPCCQAKSIGTISAGKVRALAVTTAARSEVLPEVPTVGDFVPGFEASTWARHRRPRIRLPKIVDRLNKEINAALADPKIKARLADLGSVPTPMSPADLGKLIVAETKKWVKVVRAANIKLQVFPACASRGDPNGPVEACPVIRPHAR